MSDEAGSFFNFMNTPRPTPENIRGADKVIDIITLELAFGTPVATITNIVGWPLTALITHLSGAGHLALARRLADAAKEETA